MCKNCPKKAGTRSGSRKVSAFGPGRDVKVRYLGDSEELLSYEGAATRKEYVVGGKINLVTVDSRDLATGVSWAPGLLEMSDGKGKGGKLFEIHVPLKEEVEAEAEAEARKEKAWEDAEALALPSEELVKPKRSKAKAIESDGEGTVSGD